MVLLLEVRHRLPVLPRHLLALVAIALGDRRGLGGALLLGRRQIGVPPGDNLRQQRRVLRLDRFQLRPPPGLPGGRLLVESVLGLLDLAVHRGGDRGRLLFPLRLDGLAGDAMRNLRLQQRLPQLAIGRRRLPPGETVEPDDQCRPDRQTAPQAHGNPGPVLPAEQEYGGDQADGGDGEEQPEQPGAFKEPRRGLLRQSAELAVGLGGQFAQAAGRVGRGHRRRRLGIGIVCATACGGGGSRPPPAGAAPTTALGRPVGPATPEAGRRGPCGWPRRSWPLPTGLPGAAVWRPRRRPPVAPPRRWRTSSYSRRAAP